MRYLFALLCVGALGAFSLIGCSDTEGTGGTAGAGGTAGDGGSAGDGGTGGDTAEISLFVQGFEPEGATGPLAGVEVCELDTDNCVTTNESGNAVLEVPAEQEVAVTYVKEGYAKYVNMLVVPVGGIGEPTGMATDQRFQEMHQLVGSPYPMEGTGTVFIDIVNRYEGATLSLVGDATGKAWYRDEELDWDPDLTASTAGGGGNEHGGPRMTSGAAAD